MKTFQQFLTEVYDKDLSTATRKPGEGGRVRTSRKKTDSEIRRVKAVGGGKTAPVQSYKDRKDIGTQKPRSQREQQPTQARGSAALSPREQQRKAALERRAGKSGGSKKDLEKAASKMLSKKTTKTVDPKYKVVRGKPGATPTKRAYSRAERQKITRAGQRLVRDIKKGKEKPISHYDPKV